MLGCRRHVRVSYFLTERTALELGWRYHHISNAGTHQPNNRINSSLPIVGFSMRLD